MATALGGAIVAVVKFLDWREDRALKRVDHAHKSLRDRAMRAVELIGEALELLDRAELNKSAVRDKLAQARGCLW